MFFVCVGGFGGGGVTQALSSINAPICLTCRPLCSSLRKQLFCKVSDVNESSRTRSQGCKQRADEVSGLFMHCCHLLEGWAPVPSNWGASRPHRGPEGSDSGPGALPPL